MQKKILPLLVILFFINLFACNTTKKSLNKKPEAAKNTSLPLSAGGCKVKAEMITPFHKTKNEQTNYYAKIKILSVINRGNNYMNQLNAGSEIEVNFQSSSEKTDKNFIDLKKGAKFIAIIESRLKLNSNQPLYIIANYKLNP